MKPKSFINLQSQIVYTNVLEKTIYSNLILKKVTNRCFLLAPTYYFVSKNKTITWGWTCGVHVTNLINVRIHMYKMTSLSILWYFTLWFILTWMYCKPCLIACQWTCVGFFKYCVKLPTYEQSNCLFTIDAFPTHWGIQIWVLNKK